MPRTIKVESQVKVFSPSEKNPDDFSVSGYRRGDLEFGENPFFFYCFIECLVPIAENRDLIHDPCFDGHLDLNLVKERIEKKKNVVISHVEYCKYGFLNSGPFFIVPDDVEEMKEEELLKCKFYQGKIGVKMLFSE